jgi:hypothetical protein
MPRVSPIQTNFTAGEISPQLRGRTDLKHYFNGVKESVNNIIKPQGGAFKRPGTAFIGEVKDSSKLVILVEFEYSDIQGYILEFGENYIRFYKNNVLILSGPPVEIVTTYLENELRDLDFAQSADVLYITHPSHPPMQLQRFSDVFWTFVPYVNLDGPYLPTNKTDTTITVSNVVDTATITSTNNDFVVGDVGKYVEYNSGGKLLIAPITAYIDAKNVTVGPIQNILDTLDPTAILSYLAPTITSSIDIFSLNNVGSYIRRAPNAWHLISAIPTTTTATVAAAVIQVATTGIISFHGRVITATATASSAIFVASDVGRHLRLNFLSTQVWGKITTFTSSTVVQLSLDTPVPDKQIDPRDPSPGVGNGYIVPENADPNLYESN